MFLALIAIAQLRQPSVYDIVKAERDFSAMSANIGCRKSFLANFAPDCVIFAPGPVNGIKRTTADPESTGSLIWEPVRAEIAESGEMGYTTGPWTYKIGDKSGAGQYFSIWKVQPDGKWKVVVDAGSGNADGKPRRLILPTRDFRPRSGSWPGSTERDGLMSVDRLLGSSPKELEARSWPDLYLLQSTTLPHEGREAIKSIVAPEKEQALFADVSSSGEFGYTYGSTEKGGKHGSYVRVWRKNRAHEWKVAVYVLLPVR